MLNGNKIFLSLMAMILITFNLSAGNNVKQDKLRDILKKTAQYCNLLEENVFHFICREKVTETQSRTRYNTNNLHYGNYRQNLPRANKIKNTYVNEYQIIKKGKFLKEWRKLLKFNGKKY